MILAFEIPPVVTPRRSILYVVPFVGVYPRSVRLFNVNEKCPLDEQPTVTPEVAIAYNVLKVLAVPSAEPAISVMRESQSPLIAKVSSGLEAIMVSSVAPENKGCGRLLESSVLNPGTPLVHPKVINENAIASVCFTGFI